jgi:hypothetical protein
MMISKAILLFTVVVFFYLPIYAQLDGYPFRTKKKLIVFNSGVNYWTWSKKIKDDLPSMQANRPYVNGVIFHTGPYEWEPPLAFNNETWTESTLRFDELKTIATKWTTFTDNFILYYPQAKKNGPDFFDDALWSKIYNNAVLVGKAVKTAGCKGIMLDAEFYYTKETYSPWTYKKTTTIAPPYIKRGQSLDQVRAKARQRGREIVEALQVHMPKIVILSTFLYSGVYPQDPTKLPDSAYALFPAFVDGMIEALNPESIIIDGNEGSYYVDETRKYVEDSDQADYGHVRRSVQKLCAADLLSKWNKQGQVGMAPYWDLCNNIYLPKSWRTPEYLSKWTTHNLYHSLLITDEYVWLYVEGMDFWSGKDAPTTHNTFEDIRIATEKFRNGEALGYDMYKVASTYQYQHSPIVTITSPATNTIIETDGNITINANVSAGATSIRKVEFYVNSNKVGEDTTAPYSFTRSFKKRDYILFARVFTTDGKHNSSAPVMLLAGSGTPNQLPTTSLTSPANGASYTAPASIYMQANASDPDGTISKVEFYNGSTLLHTENLAPYQYTWTNVSSGTYTLTAKAYDNLGASVITSPIAITVKPAPTPTLYTLQLKKDWNLISVPIQPIDTDIADVLAPISGAYTAVHSWNGTAYESYYPGSATSTLNKIEAGRGYWIWMNQDATLQVKGSEASKVIELKRDWNMTGFNSMTEMAVSSALGSAASKVGVIYAYDAVSKGYEVVETLQPGRGYWILATSDVTWKLLD